MPKRLTVRMSALAALLAAALALFACAPSSSEQDLPEGNASASHIESVDSGHDQKQESSSTDTDAEAEPAASEAVPCESLEGIGAYAGDPVVEISGGIPSFSDDELNTFGREYYAPLDSLNRAVLAFACVGPETMPTEERGSIGSVKPSGWHLVKYAFIDGKYLFNRCHLVGYQLSGENANESNLITGTRYLNVELMLPYENRIDDYVDATGNHVAYRVTPVYEGDNLVATGVHLEAQSVEDGGAGVCFNVFLYNIQPGVSIDYATGESHADGQAGAAAGSAVAGGTDDGSVRTYVLNNSSKKFHKPECSSADDISEKNRGEFTGTRDAIIERGYDPCGRCNP